jgi:LPXTG-motif cell wall-anchored protein
MSERRSPLLRTVAGLGSMMLGSVVLMGALPGSAGAEEHEAPQTPTSSVVAGNPTCGALGGYEFEFKIDEEDPDGTYVDPVTGIEVTVTIVHDDPMTIDFTSSIAVSAVFVKAGPGGILYTYDPPVTEGSGLESPKDSISHISFCWDEEDKETTTSSTEKDKETTTSSTEKDKETTTSSTEKDKETTTTTVVDEETTTTVKAEDTTTTTVAPTGELPRTGSTTFPLVAVGGLLLAAGFGLLLTTRLRRS